MSSNVFFCLVSSPKSKDIHFIIMYDTEKRHIFTYERLKQANLGHFCLMNIFMTCLNCSIYSSNCPKLTYCMVTIIYDKENDKILIFKKLEPENV